LSEVPAGCPAEARPVHEEPHPVQETDPFLQVAISAIEEEEGGNGGFGDGAEVDLPTMEEAERALIRQALERFDGNRRKTAEALGISERTLYRKLKQMEENEQD
jgi:DNA-binding NtrC family response regulator